MIKRTKKVEEQANAIILNHLIIYYSGFDPIAKKHNYTIYTNHSTQTIKITVSEQEHAKLKKVGYILPF